MKDINDILAMAQNVQNELQRAQASLDTIEVEGASGGGLVKVRASAKGRIIGLDIDESLLQPSEKGMLEDLIVAAHNDAKSKIEMRVQEETQRLMGGLPLPPGMKLPF